MLAMGVLVTAMALVLGLRPAWGSTLFILFR